MVVRRMAGLKCNVWYCVVVVWVGPVMTLTEEKVIIRIGQWVQRVGALLGVGLNDCMDLLWNL